MALEDLLGRASAVLRTQTMYFNLRIFWQDGINHFRTYPSHPQPNSQVEWLVGAFKNALQKSKEEETTGKVSGRFLIIYRPTPKPQTINGVSTTETLLGRKIHKYLEAIRLIPDLEHQRSRSMKKHFN